MYIEGRLEVKGKRGRRHKQLLDEFKEKRAYWRLRDEAFYCTLRGFGRGYGPVWRRTTTWMGGWMNKEVLKYLDLTWLQILQSYELQCLTSVFLYYNWIWINSNPDSYPGFRVRISAQVLVVLSQIIHGFAVLPGAGGTVGPLRTPIPLPLASFPVLSQLILTFEGALNHVWIKGADFFRVYEVYIIDISKRVLRVIWQFIAHVNFQQSNGMGSRRPRGLRRGSAATRFLGLRVRILPVAWFSVSCDCFVLYKVEVSATVWSLVQRSPINMGCSWVWFWSLDC